MSEPMRFGLKHNGQLSCIEHCPEGEYVLHSEYATLQARVERLTKAGDAMASRLMDGGVILSGHLLAEDWFKSKWRAAKEGKQP